MGCLLILIVVLWNEYRKEVRAGRRGCRNTPQDRLEKMLERYEQTGHFF
jgi:hypothetical protein